MRKWYSQALIVLMLVLGFSVVPRSFPVYATGNLYVSPAATGALPVGSTFTVQVKVSGFDQFNGYEIQILSDNSVINATSIMTTGNIFQANTTGGLGFELRNCVNGSGSGCCRTNACSPFDSVGVADSSYADTKLASGSGLLFNVTFKVVSTKPYSPITIENDVLSNGGSSVVHTTASGSYGQISSVGVSKFFTDGSFNPLSMDTNGNPSVNVTLANGVVRSTNPGVILGWVNITNTGQTALQSLKLNDTLPVDWQIQPPWLPAAGAIHVYYANTTSLATNPEITDPSTITVSGTNPETVSIALSNIANTGVGHNLLPGQSILLSVNLKYGLKMTSQSFASYPRSYSDTAGVAAWTQPSYTGSESVAAGSASFVAHAKVLGDVDGDGSVNIIDVSLISIAYGSTPGSPRWNPNADFANTGYIGIADVSIVFYYYGTSS